MVIDEVNTFSATGVGAKSRILIFDPLLIYEVAKLRVTIHYLIIDHWTWETIEAIYPIKIVHIHSMLLLWTGLLFYDFNLQDDIDSILPSWKNLYLVMYDLENMRITYLQFQVEVVSPMVCSS